MHRSVGKPACFGDTHLIGCRSSQNLQGSRKAVLTQAGKRGNKERAGKGSGQPLYVTLEADGSDLWRLDPIIKMLQEGAMGILPTDSYPALVCDVDAKRAVERLYQAKEMSPSKQLSILCKNFSDIQTYTLGFPTTSSGQDTFRIAKRVLPGPYTLILLASKKMPKQCVDYLTGQSRTRRTVGVRMPGDPICLEVLQRLERPLLSTSVHVEAEGELEFAEAAIMMDMFAGKGLDFVVDCGLRVSEGSTIIDLTSREPALIREGKGNASVFIQEALAVSV
ncbi:hypothetical protein CVIRNUC_000640 [Coccomyxa viridis]|uniref:Threonylcarbamoyl-AMP synthase n=1 Tax=Coccomyxa viridis TaxID=1274662 RepID=A0AAV1HRE4_9CHLO|nr:hypothetical protein CVIRNUC_000640 [Coccomyxa viridis]